MATKFLTKRHLIKNSRKKVIELRKSSAPKPKIVNPFFQKPLMRKRTKWKKVKYEDWIPTVQIVLERIVAELKGEFESKTNVMRLIWESPEINKTLGWSQIEKILKILETNRVYVPKGSGYTKFPKKRKDAIAKMSSEANLGLSEERKREIIAYYEKYGGKATAKKYGYASTAIRSTVFNFRKQLKK